ncbi:hypothetical protein K438DRAFT_1784686 [Mycena galopus ATCC 62051]|nr:hypothetical protein K438DRAFT_1784686 [Mycena galopus ATCC 62051]
MSKPIEGPAECGERPRFVQRIFAARYQTTTLTSSFEEQDTPPSHQHSSKQIRVRAGAFKTLQTVKRSGANTGGQDGKCAWRRASQAPPVRVHRAPRARRLSSPEKIKPLSLSAVQLTRRRVPVPKKAFPADAFPPVRWTKIVHACPRISARRKIMIPEGGNEFSVQSAGKTRNTNVTHPSPDPTSSRASSVWCIPEGEGGTKKNSRRRKTKRVEAQRDCGERTGGKRRIWKVQRDASQSRRNPPPQTLPTCTKALHARRRIMIPGRRNRVLHAKCGDADFVKTRRKKVTRLPRAKVIPSELCLVRCIHLQPIDVSGRHIEKEGMGDEERERKGEQTRRDKGRTRVGFWYSRSDNSAAVPSSAPAASRRRGLHANGQRWVAWPVLEPESESDEEGSRRGETTGRARLSWWWHERANGWRCSSHHRASDWI